MDLDGKRLLVTVADKTTGVALSVAALAQELGAQVLLARAPGALGSERLDRREPYRWELVELDLEDPDDHAALRAKLEPSGRLDGAFHPIAPAAHAQPGGGPRAEMERAASAFVGTAYSLNALARAVAPLMQGPSRPPRSIVGLGFDSSVGRPGSKSLGVTAALEAVNRYLACDLGPRGIRVNLVAAGPFAIRDADAEPGSDQTDAGLRSMSAESDARAAAAARAVCFLLSDWARAVSGEILHVDGAAHLSGASGRDLLA